VKYNQFLVYTFFYLGTFLQDKPSDEHSRLIVQTTLTQSGTCLLAFRIDIAPEKWPKQRTYEAVASTASHTLARRLHYRHVSVKLPSTVGGGRNIVYRRDTVSSVRLGASRYAAMTSSNSFSSIPHPAARPPRAMTSP